TYINPMGRMTPSTMSPNKCLLSPRSIHGERARVRGHRRTLTLTLSMTHCSGKSNGCPGRGVKFRLLSVVFVRGPAGHLEVDRAHEILAQIEVELDLFLSVVRRQELLRVLNQVLVGARLVLPQLDETDDHPGLDLLQDLEPALRVDFQE